MSVEVEDIAAGSSCTQLVWTKHMLKEYDVSHDVMTLYYDNMRATTVAKNPIQRNKIKHIDIHHHFIKDLVSYKIISLEHVIIENQLADIFTKVIELLSLRN